MQLERSVSTTQAILYGVGVIVGAGIYTLIGVGAGIAGNALWISFIIAAIVAYLTALSYSELSSKFSKEGAETLYVNKAFNNQKLAFFIGFLSIITWVVSSATVAFGFASYAKLFIPFTPTLIAIGAIILFSIINFLGIQKGVKINNILTIVTISGLLLIIIFGLRFVGQVNLFLGFDGTNLLENSFSLIPSLFSAAALVFFAYLGFEGLANIGEETKEPKKTIPLAIIVSLSIATLLYVAVAIISVSVVSPIELLSAATANSLTQGPLALVAEKAIDPSFGFWLSLIALCATGSTLIVLLNVSSRIIYGLSEQHFFPKVFGLINPKTKTPFVAVIVATVLSIICALVGNLVLLGNMATMSTFLLFFAVNSSLIAIKQKEKSLNDYDNPFSLKRLSFPALLGALFCLFMFLTQFWFPVNVFGIEVPMIGIGAVVFAISIPLYYLFKKFD